MTAAAVVGVIPSRWASIRLPGKSLVPICGKPLVQWVVEACNRAATLTRVVVATDDTRIRDAVSGFGGEAVMTRPDHPSGTDRVAEAVQGGAADVIINIQGDEPMIDPDVIDRLAALMLSDVSLDMGTAVSPLARAGDRENPNIVKVVRNAAGRALYFSRSVIPFVRDADVETDGLFWRHIGIYAYRRAFLERLVATPPCRLEQAEKLEQLRALHLGGQIGTIETEDVGVGVDTPEDVVRVEALMRERAEQSGTGV